MGVRRVIKLSEATNLLNGFKSMSKKDQKRFSQCFNCAELSACKRAEESEDENGLCKFFRELPKSEQKDFADILGREIKRITEEE